MSKRRIKKRHSPAFIFASWLASVLSIGLVWYSGHALTTSLAGFRSCSANNNDLYISSCGKHALNAGDFILIGLFILSAALVLSLFTGSWRMTRGLK